MATVERDANYILRKTKMVFFTLLLPFSVLVPVSSNGDIGEDE